MDKYLLSILKEVNTIIIPGLGALTLVNEDKGEYMFMPYLKHDDGKLASFISEREGMDINDAKNLIAKYVREIQATLDKGEEYNMYAFGAFYKDGDDIAFRSSGEIEHAAEVKAESTPVEVIDSTPSEETVENTLENEEGTEAESIIEQPNETNEDTEEEIPYEEANDAIETLLEVNEIVSEETVQTETEAEPEPERHIIEKQLTIVEKEEIEKGREKIKQLKAIQENKPQKKRRGPAFYILTVLVIAIISLGTLFGINYDSWKQHIPFLADNEVVVKENDDHKEKMKEILGLDDDENENTDDQAEEDPNTPDETSEAESELALESSDAIEEKSEIAESEIMPTETNSGSFHAIAGAFSSKDNADRLTQKLKDQGYPAFVQQRGNMYWVSMKQYNSMQEAAGDVNQLKAVIPQVWIYKGSL